jgi:hypothetical protein
MAGNYRVIEAMITLHGITGTGNSTTLVAQEFVS